MTLPGKWRCDQQWLLLMKGPTSVSVNWVQDNGIGKIQLTIDTRRGPDVP